MAESQRQRQRRDRIDVMSIIIPSLRFLIVASVGLDRLEARPSSNDKHVTGTITSDTRLRTLPKTGADLFSSRVRGRLQIVSQRGKLEPTIGSVTIMRYP